MDARKRIAFAWTGGSAVLGVFTRVRSILVRPYGLLDVLRAVWRQPGFRWGLLLKLATVVLLAPSLHDRYFLPFLQEAGVTAPLDPWTRHLDLGGDPKAFPYGWPLAVYLLPAGAWARWMNELGAAHLLSGLVLRIELLAADVALLVALAWRYTRDIPQLIKNYWLSPILFFVTYWHGQVDILPTALLVIAIALLISRRREAVPTTSTTARWRPRVPAGASLLGVAFISKLSTVLAVPFLAILALRNRRYRPVLWPRGALILAGVLALLTLPWLALSEGFRAMVFGTPELMDVYQFSVVFADEDQPQTLFFLPLIFVAFFYSFYRVRRPSAEYTLASVGIAYLLVVSLTPASPGWFLWVLPFMASYTIMASRTARVLLMAFNLLVVLTILLEHDGPSLLGASMDLDVLLMTHVGPLLPAMTFDLLLTLRSSVGLLLAASIYMHARFMHGEVAFSRGPLAVGIAGDSGTGKDTLSSALAGLFEEGATASVSGDDYHRFERGSPMWQRLTHLHPSANNLGRFSRDVLSLLEGHAILCRHYDHTYGRFIPNQLIRGSEVILVSGLHAFYPNTLQARFDSKIFLDMDERLRRYFKVRRDTKKRQQTLERIVASMDARVPDFERYVQPQRDLANLVFRLEPVRPTQLEPVLEGPESPDLQLRVTTSDDLPLDELADDFLAIGGVSVRLELGLEHPARRVLVVPDEHLEPSLMAGLAARHVPYIDEILGTRPDWKGGLLGVMQLLVLLQVSERFLLSRRGRA